MTTATDWQDATWDTGALARVTDVTSAATPDAPVRVGGWTPGQNNRPDHIHDDLCRKVQPAEYADEPTPQAGVAPDVADITKRIDLQLASYRLMRHQETKAELWRAEANRMWAEQGVTSRISERYTDRREALLTAYEQESRRLLDGLDHAPYGAYVQALPDYVRGHSATVATQRHSSVYEQLAPPRIHANVPPDNRVDRMIEDPERYFAEARQRAERQVQAELGADLEAGPPHRLPPGDFPMPDYADDPSSEPEPKPEPEQPADRAGLVKLAKRVPTALTTGEQPAQAEPERRGRLRRMWDAIRAWDGTGA